MDNSMPEKPEDKQKKNRRLLIICLAILLILVLIIGIAFVYFKPKTSTTSNQQPQPTPTKVAEAKLKKYWIYEDIGENQLYIYDSGSNESKTFLKLTENERFEISNDGKQILRTRDNIVEIADAALKPEFKQVYSDEDSTRDVHVVWLPDNSGFVVVSDKATTSGQGLTQHQNTVYKVLLDDSAPKKLFEFPLTYHSISIEGIDLNRDEIYYSQSGEGGMSVSLGSYRLSDGTKLKTYDANLAVQPFPVANGKAYKTKVVQETSTGKEKAQIIEINLDDSKEKVIYETLTAQGTKFTRGGVQFREGIETRSLKLSLENSILYFNEVHNLAKPVTKIKALSLSDNIVKEVYTPTMIGSYITAEILAADSKGLLAEISCGGCTTAEFNSLGKEYVSVDLSTGTSQLAKKTSSSVRWISVQSILLPE